MRRGDVWLAEVAGVQGAHPVVLLSPDDTYARRRAIIAIITSQPPRRSTDIAVDEHNGLDRASVCKTDDLHTIRLSELVEHQGALDAEQLHALNAALRRALGLDS
jgi:mRNA-degrading endonuclease toxin of MazEF toxin-antitoxin module